MENDRWFVAVGRMTILLQPARTILVSTCCMRVIINHASLTLRCFSVWMTNYMVTGAMRNHDRLFRVIMTWWGLYSRKINLKEMDTWKWREERPEAEKLIRCLLSSSQEMYWKSELGQGKWKGNNWYCKLNWAVLQI